MVKLGKVYGNLMVDLRATNAKLRDRTERIVMTACHVSRPKAKALICDAHGWAKAAIVMHGHHCGYEEACERLTVAGGFIHKALGAKP